MTSLPLAEKSAPTVDNGGGRSKTVVDIMLSNRRETLGLSLLLPLIIGAGLALVALFWLWIKGYQPEVFTSFFAFNIVMPVLLICAFALSTYGFISGNLKFLLGLGLKRTDIWWAVLKVAGLRAGISTALIALFSGLEIVTRGYGFSWQVFSSNLDLYEFYLHGNGYGQVGALIESVRFTGHWFLALFAAQLAGALLGLLKLRFGLLVTGACALILVLCAIGLSASSFGSITWDLGISDLYYPYYEVYDGQSYSLEMNTGFPAVEDLQTEIYSGQMVGYEPLSVLHIIAFGLAKFLGFAVLLYLTGALILKRTDLR